MDSFKLFSYFHIHALACLHLHTQDIHHTHNNNDDEGNNS